jgi:hypothetical protein
MGPGKKVTAVRISVVVATQACPALELTPNV